MPSNACWPMALLAIDIGPLARMHTIIEPWRETMDAQQRIFNQSGLGPMTSRHRILALNMSVYYIAKKVSVILHILVSQFSCLRAYTDHPWVRFRAFPILHDLLDYTPAAARETTHLGTG